MSTPTTFFGALGMGDVTSGFLNRLLVVHTPLGRQKSRHTRLTEPPQPVVQWAKITPGPRPTTKTLATFARKMNRDGRAEPIELPFTEDFAT